MSSRAVADDERASTSQGELIVHVPFLYNPPLEKSVVVEVKVNGKGPYPFMLDTGAEAPVMIDRWAADEMGLKPTGEEHTVTPGNIKVRLAKLGKLSIDGNEPGQVLTINAEAAVVGNFGSALKELRPLKVAGFLGLPFFNMAKVQFDFASHLLSLYPPSASMRYGSGAIKIPLHQIGWKAFASVAPDGGKPVGMRLDTGADISDVPQSVARRLKPIVVGMSFRHTLAGRSLVQAGLVGSFVIGETELHNVFVSPVLSACGVLGLDVLSHFKATIDLPDGSLVLEPDGIPNSFLPGATGVSITGRDGMFLIDSVGNSSATQKAGLSVGDQLIKVDGQPVIGMDTEVVVEILEGSANTAARLLVKNSSGVSKIVEFQRIPITDPSHYLAPGFRLERLDQYSTAHQSSVIVLTILCSSSAWKAGVRGGDTLLSVNGLSVKSMPLAQIAALLQKPSSKLTLSVRHLGAKEVQTVTLPIANPPVTSGSEPISTSPLKPSQD